MEIEDFDQFQKDHKWTYAKTYAKWCPHWYLVKNQIADQEGFKAFLEHIDRNGIWMAWGKNTRKYYDHKNYRYWHMHTTSTLHEAVIINRERIKDSKCTLIPEPRF